NPSGADIVIRDKKGNEVHRGLTPTTLTLSASAGYFKPAKYTMEVALNGYNVGKGSVTAGMNGWYAGNIIFGGLIGLLIVDPATGAMFKLPKEYAVNLVPLKAINSGERQLHVLSLNDL